jgi:hypothetical protein
VSCGTSGTKTGSHQAIGAAHDRDWCHRAEKSSLQASMNARALDRKAGFLLLMIRGSGGRWKFSY